MQNANLRTAGFRVVDLLVSTIGPAASGRLPPGAASALAAPVAMLAGAVGLTAVWAAGPRLILPSSLPPPTAATPRQADAVEAAGLKNGQALDRLLVDLGSPVQLVQPPQIRLTTTAADAVADLQLAESQMISAADLEAQARLKSMRAIFRATGLDARPYMAATVGKAPLSPLELRDTHVLAARFDIDSRLARQVQQTARDLMAAEALGDAEAALPLATPVDAPVLSSPFGTRVDPFTHAAAFHPGQDFSGRYGEAVKTTAPGVISFVGQRSGYGNCVEVDHGYGFKTRYGHLSGFVLGVGSPVKTGDVIGRMGSTGRSTGVHLHYEVWANGRLLNPAPFLRTGAPTLKG